MKKECKHGVKPYGIICRQCHPWACTRCNGWRKLMPKPGLSSDLKDCHACDGTGKYTDMNVVRIYTDGSCYPNPGAGGWGAVLEYHRRKKPKIVKEIFGPGEKGTTNNRMEMMGVIKALEALRRKCVVEIYSDSQYVVKAVKEGWIYGWIRNGWITAAGKPVKNRDLWLKIKQLAAEHDVTWDWVRGHNGHPQNERADALALKGRKKAEKEIKARKNARKKNRSPC